ncbi:hypothetical protein ACIA49_29385 [Kribbella sp. NPDC051587]|uniref:hypothetical protein n=1 Tax=Kribbella sp. NPDC051587 TaxID=3364119 RepID=UPI00378CECCD
MFKPKPSRTLTRAVVATATLASVALLPAGLANATPLTGEAATPAAPASEACTIVSHGQRIYFFSLSNAVLGTVGDGQKINVTGRQGDWTLGVLWGRTDITKIGSYWVYCPV